MCVEDCDATQSGGGEARAEISQDCHKSRGRDRECARKAEMLVALAVADRRQGVDGRVCGKQIKGAAEQFVINQSIGRKRQMRAMLFDSGSRQNEKSSVARKSINLLPVQVGEVPTVGNAGLHARDSSVAADCWESESAR